MFLLEKVKLSPPAHMFWCLSSNSLQKSRHLRLQPWELARLVSAIYICPSFSFISEEKLNRTHMWSFLKVQQGSWKGRLQGHRGPAYCPCLARISLCANLRACSPQLTSHAEIANGTKPTILKSLWRPPQKSLHSIGILTQRDWSKILTSPSSLDTITD